MPTSHFRDAGGRLDRICVTLWFGYGIIYGVVLANNGNLRPLITDGWNQISVGRVLQLFFCPLSFNLNASLMGDISQCTNEPAWFVGAMLPSWLAYPLFQRLYAAPSRTHRPYPAYRQRQEPAHIVPEQLPHSRQL
eukprot:7191775-Prymnesium_polylepis.1